MARLSWIAALLVVAAGSALAERLPSPGIEVNVPRKSLAPAGRRKPRSRASSAACMAIKITVKARW